MSEQLDQLTPRLCYDVGMGGAMQGVSFGKTLEDVMVGGYGVLCEWQIEAILEGFSDGISYSKDMRSLADKWAGAADTRGESDDIPL